MFKEYKSELVSKRLGPLGVCAVRGREALAWGGAPQLCDGMPPSVATLREAEGFAVL